MMRNKNNFKKPLKSKEKFNKNNHQIKLKVFNNYMLNAAV